MANLDYDAKLASKPYRFFDLLFRLLVINILTVILSCTVILLFPSLVACNATIKQGNTSVNVFRQYFKNFLKYLKKSFLVGFILFILYAVTCWAIYFYSKAEIIDGTDNYLTLFLNAGFLVSFIAFFVITFLSVHLPLLIITFEKLSVREIYRTSFYITFRYLLTTLILFILQIVIIGVFVLCIVDPRILAIWLLIGISLPVFLQVKITQTIYYKFSQVDFEKIMKRVEEEDDDEE